MARSGQERCGTAGHGKAGKASQGLLSQGVFRCGAFWNLVEFCDGAWFGLDWLVGER